MIRNLTGIRGTQIVSALREHGPLSIRTLASFLQPPANRNRLARSMKRLSDQGLIRRHHTSLPNNAGHYYALNFDKSSRVKVGSMLGIAPEQVKLAHIHGSELKHSEQCAIWAEFFKKSFPEARVVRDWEWRKEVTLVENFVGERGDRDLLPDFVVTFPKKDHSLGLQIGVEIERTRKAPARLVKKVHGILYRTLLDGVVYVCDRFDVAEGVRRAFLNGALTKSRRIGRYAKDFVIFSKYDACAEMMDLSGVNLALETRDIRSWIDRMNLQEQHLRDSSLFEEVASAGPR